MTITVEDVAPGQKRLKIEVPADRVQQTVDRVTADFQREARIPGFRPGHAPRLMIAKKFQRDIESETQRALVPEAYREAVAEKKLRVVAQPAIEDLKYQPGLSLSFSTLVELLPDFRLPEYKSLVVKRPPIEVSDAEIDATLNHLADQRAHFHDATGRGLELGDYAVVSYRGTLGGEPFAERLTGDKKLAVNNRFWLWVRPESFLPGFAEQLLGLKAEESRTVRVTLAADFPEPAVAGQEIEYAVELHEIKVKHAPEIDDQFAQDLAKVNLAELRELMRKGQSRQKAVEAEQAAQRQIVQQLVDAVDFTLPPSLLEEETEQSIHEIVSENQARGISPQLLEEKKAEIFENAAKNARTLTKFKFIAARIAEQEKIEVSNEQFARHLSGLAQREEITLEKLIERLRKNEALGLVREQVLRQAVLDFLLKEAKTE